MRAAFAFASGILAGTFLIRERRRRAAAERFAAAALESLLNAIDANDAQTGSHVRRVAAYALILAEAAEVDEHERRTVERVALFHDIGKIDEALFDIIHDESALTPQERRAIATHPARGAQVLAPLMPFYPDLAEGVLAHHEHWDGQGYPRHLRGQQIPLAARIVTLADTFDAITHSRRYRHGRNVQAAAKIIAAGRGTQFDPDLVDLMLFPPVFKRFVHEQRRRQGPARPRVVDNDRRTGETETQVPDVTFRWRLESRESHPRDPQRQEVPR